MAQKERKKPTVRIELADEITDARDAGIACAEFLDFSQFERRLRETYRSHIGIPTALVIPPKSSNLTPSVSATIPPVVRGDVQEPKPSTRTAKAGRRNEWVNLLKMYDCVSAEWMGKSETEIRKEARRRYNRRYARRGSNPKASTANLRNALSYRRNKSPENQKHAR